ncbi:response regulator [Limnohabitans sp.]|uniref:response regulator n=1 Tax=Limnohabitans sp. TaxID=1907725 RepID=UPI00311D828F
MHNKTNVIAVVDDNEEFSTVLVSLLNENGFEAYAFNDPIACIDRMQSWKPDILLTDYEMPQMTGIDLVRNIHQILPDLPCLLVTGSSEILLKSKATSAGCSAVIFKPFELNELITAINIYGKFK